MRFRTFEWPQMPTALEIARRRDIWESDREGGYAGDGGARCSVVTGAGQFAGENASRDFEALRAVMEEPGPGLLTLPGMPPFWAVAKELVCVGKPLPNTVGYRFVFMEAEPMADIQPPRRVQVLSGETLWDTAFRCGVRMDTLWAANPQIPKPHAAREGEWVMLE